MEVKYNCNQCKDTGTYMGGYYGTKEVKCRNCNQINNKQMDITHAAQDVTHAAHRNHVFLITYTEYVFRVLNGHANYNLDEMAKIVNDYRKLGNFNDYFDDFSIAFAEWCIGQKWDKTSASLGIDNDGNNVAKSTKELMEDFKDFMNTTEI